MPVISEYGSVEMELSHRQAEALQQTKYVEVSPAAGSRWKVTATSYVGTLVIGDVEILVRPKINPENLFLLLEPGLPAQAWQEEAFEYESSPNLLTSVLSFFARTVETTLGRGVLRSYIERNESLTAMRGRLDTSGQFKNPGLISPMACTFDDYSENIIENRALRAAVRAALRVPRVQASVRQRLMRQLVALESVEDSRIRPEDIDSIHFNRLNQHYAPALGLARLILANLTLSDARGNTSAMSFMVNMNALFQNFVTERLRRELRGRLDVIEEHPMHLGNDRQVFMQPDLLFRRPDGITTYVGDIKYKLTSEAQAKSSDYYQLLAYTIAKNLPEGILIYCRHLGGQRHRSVAVRNADKRLVVYSIDLTGAPDQVELEIRELAHSIATAAGDVFNHAGVPSREHRP